MSRWRSYLGTLAAAIAVCVLWVAMGWLITFLASAPMP